MTREEHLALCACGHVRGAHFGVGHAEDCGFQIAFGVFCKCKKFREAIKEKENEEMAKKNKKSHGPRKARQSNLLYFADKAKIEKFDDGRLLDKKEKTYTAAIAQSLVAAGKEGMRMDDLVAAVGKIVEHKNQATLRKSVQWYLGTKRSDVFKFVESKRVEASAKANGSAKPKGPRKPRAKRPAGPAAEPPTSAPERRAVDEADLGATL